ncbi:hypothetical protein [Leptolyngbya sp. FACHB-16]|uniref:hypothetical protein n=1 Tax=unclassified Leptolyngbya TaxID=2650499 RepID=UPI001682106D|nr:hypothetical protein [Leptolyngbya sp. FACHB-16]MBD2156031.1 hypothetical protein [Leptolyngbya sp. FACHB-16]
MNESSVLIPRKQVKAELSKERWGACSTRKLDQSTLWRWCDLLGIPTGLNDFTLEEYTQLLRLAQHYRSGGSTKEILEELAK